jgi:hypothetical protein
VTTSILTEPPVIEGDCPACCGTYPVTEAHISTGTALQVPEHHRADRRTTRRRCPCSGWLARNPRPRRYFFVEGVRFL